MKLQRSFMKGDFTIIREFTPKGWNMPYSHLHNSYEIYILNSGERTVEIDDENYSVSAADVTLFDKNVPHRSYGETAYSGICIKFKDYYLNTYFSALAKQELLACFQYPVIHLSDEQLDYIQTVTDCFDEAASYNFAILANILAMLNAAAASYESSDENTEKTATIAEQLISYVDNNYTSISNVSYLTELFNISDSYVYKIFKTKLNTTPNKYIYKLRIDCACHWLEITDRTVKSIALSSGFKSSEHFMRIFKALKGCTPNEYRKSVQNVSAYR